MSKAKKPKKKTKLVHGDDAIESSEADWFDFETPARELAKQLYEISKSSGVCCGIIGSWGSGKSSFMKLMDEYVRKKLSSNVCVAWFIAWDPGGIEDLGDSMLYHLFHDIAGKNKALSSAFKKLQKALLPRNQQAFFLISFLPFYHRYKFVSTNLSFVLL